MSWGRVERYYCVNVERCRYAAEDLAYSQAEFEGAEGRCAGRDKDGCGEPLRRGRPIDRRPRLAVAAAAVLTLILVGGPLARRALFPPALEHVAFAQVETHTTQTGATLAVEVERDASVERRLSVRFSTRDGTARAGEDYDALNGVLDFAGGERSKSIALTILPDPSLQKGERHFTLTLTNVAGSPQHVVFIEPRKADASALAQAEQRVRAASVVAKDIADFVVRERVLGDLLEASRTDARTFRDYKNTLSTVQGNLSRARESYAQFFRDFESSGPQLALLAMDNVGAQLGRQGFEQQRKAAEIMKRQFSEFLKSHEMDMDRWAQELSTVVPKLDKGKPSPIA